MSLRTASFQATYTYTLVVNSTTGEPYQKIDEDTYRVRVAEEPSLVPFQSRNGLYSWNFGTIANTYNTIIEEIGNSSGITKIQLQFYYNNAVDGQGIEVIQHDNSNPRTGTASDTTIYHSLNNVIGTANIISNQKTLVTIDLDNTNSFYYESFIAIGARLNISFEITRSNKTSIGSFEISGLTLVGGTSEWRAAIAGEPTDPPLLIIQYDVEEESHPTLSMKYTTSDPTVNQTTAENSIGGHLSLNDIYPSALIGGSISSTQLTIPIDSASSLPDSIGLASVGPEIFKYTIVDTTNHQLRGITRAISPQSAFPAGFDSFRIAEKIHYLHPDNNGLNKLFDTRPSGNLTQYRCVAIVNTDTGNNFSIQDTFIGLVQNINSDVQIKIGVELPRYDSRTGTAEDGNVETSSTVIVDSSFTEEAGFFNGALIKLLSPTEYVMVDTFADGVFLLSSSISGLDAGRNFVIMPAASQIVANDAQAPTSNSSRFLGFSENEEGIEINLLEHGNTIQENDLFYVWIKRIIPSNIPSNDDTGAVLLLRYRSI